MFWFCNFFPFFVFKGVRGGGAGLSDRCSEVFLGVLRVFRGLVLQGVPGVFRGVPGQFLILQDTQQFNPLLKLGPPDGVSYN